QNKRANVGEINFIEHNERVAKSDGFKVITIIYQSYRQARSNDLSFTTTCVLFSAFPSLSDFL
ncbi:hypothetical protein R7039_29115, partial [Vibrio sp. 1287]|uniref:hypothetical protein n=1 Tax=Vibrio sp. 1287 TaxID=3074549 RepID=UPI002964EC66